MTRVRSSPSSAKRRSLQLLTFSLSALRDPSSATVLRSPRSSFRASHFFSFRLSLEKVSNKLCRLMSKSSKKLTTDQLGRLIYEIRGERVMLDSDLASIYGVETKGLNRAVKRTRDRFPKDFVFQLAGDESELLRRQIGT